MRTTAISAAKMRMNTSAISMICRLSHSARSSSGTPCQPTLKSKKLLFVRFQPELEPTTTTTTVTSTAVLSSAMSAERRDRDRR